MIDDQIVGGESNEILRNVIKILKGVGTDDVYFLLSGENLPLPKKKRRGICYVLAWD